MQEQQKESYPVSSLPFLVSWIGFGHDANFCQLAPNSTEVFNVIDVPGAEIKDHFHMTSLPLPEIRTTQGISGL